MKKLGPCNAAARGRRARGVLFSSIRAPRSAEQGKVMKDPWLSKRDGSIPDTLKPRKDASEASTSLACHLSEPGEGAASTHSRSRLHQELFMKKLGHCNAAARG